jgi:pimeloyl-ACP methyl ester carboxylesterase
VDLLLLPGLVCDRAVWEPVLPALGRRATCHIPSYGTIDSIPGMAAHVLAQAPARFHLAGHSMGGRVALEIMRTAPDRVEALALLDTGYQARAAGPAGEAEAAGRQALVDLARREGMLAMGRQWLTGMVWPPRLAEAPLVDAIADMVARHPVAVFEAQVRALLNRPDATELLPRIACPTLVACGREDRWSPFDRHEAIARAIPGARLVGFDDCAHMAMMERPEVVAASLAAWLDGARA